MSIKNQWWVYMISCKSGSLYTGISTNVERRFERHRNGKGAKFFRLDPPQAIVLKEQFDSKSEALVREIKLKKLTRAQKLKLLEETSGV